MNLCECLRSVPRSVLSRIFDTLACGIFALLTVVNFTADAHPDVALPHPNNSGGPVVINDSLRNPTIEKLERVRKWSINTYKVRTRSCSPDRSGSVFAVREIISKWLLLRANHQQTFTKLLTHVWHYHMGKKGSSNYCAYCELKTK